MNAPRGATLTSTDTTSNGRPSRRLGLFAAVAATLYAVDVLSKVWAVDALAGRGRIDLLGPVLGLNLTRNPGAAFSLGTESTIALSLLAIAAVVTVLVVARRVRDGLWAFGLGALLAGVGGNLTDRVLRDPGPLRGHVIDFLQLPNWPIFNVADMCIIAGAVVIVVQSFRGVRLDGTLEGDDRKPDGDASDGEASDVTEPGA